MNGMPKWRITVWRGNAQIGERIVLARTKALAENLVRPQYGSDVKLETERMTSR